MTRKAALARLALGGGKAVVVGDPRTRTREQLVEFGRFVDSLDGRYFTGADMGTNEEAMVHIREGTRFVTGLPRRLGGPGDPGPFTAEGVHRALERACARTGLLLSGARVAVQGVGSVGASLVRHLLASGAQVMASDLDDAALAALPAEVTRVDAREILLQDCDILAPCGPPGVLDADLVSELRCSVVCGAANNPLTDPAVAARLAERQIVYVPDFVANAGGLIHLAVALEGGDEDSARRHLEVIPQNVDAVMDRVKAQQIDPARAADQLAAEQLSSPASCG
jgi:glutamate dehydrogenase/leucine dehydrogenase